MRKIILAAALSGTALTLAACSGGTDEAETDAETAAPAEADVADTAQAGGVLNANDASEEELAALPGMNAEMAAALIEGRPYANVVALDEALRGQMSEEQAASALEAVFVPVNLNTATREEIALIPGMTDRMIGEFLEYRPYEDMAQFDREIGKYVDEAEVARFRQYVTL
jgi:DNA uptake protein ComE-like DNA-binding protein